MRLHAIVTDEAAARRAVAGGATAVQLRLKDVGFKRALERAERVREVCRAGGACFVVNDHVRLAIEAEADCVHLGQDDLRRLEDVPPLPFGLSAATPEAAVDAERRGAAYVGAGPVWATPSKPDAGPPIGLTGLRAICAAVSIPVIAIGGVDASNAPECIGAGVYGVAVIRAVAEVEALRAAIDAAL